MPIDEPMKIFAQVFNRFLQNKKKNFFWLRGAPLILGALGPGLAGLYLKTALFVHIPYILPPRLNSKHHPP